MVLILAIFESKKRYNSETIAFHTSKRVLKKMDNLSHLKEEKNVGGIFCGSKIVFVAKFAKIK